MYANMARASNVRAFVVQQYKFEGDKRIEVPASEGWDGTDDDYLGSDRGSGFHPIRDQVTQVEPSAFAEAMGQALEAVTSWNKGEP
jgi:hypothetical protein